MSSITTTPIYGRVMMGESQEQNDVRVPWMCKGCGRIVQPNDPPTVHDPNGGCWLTEPTTPISSFSSRVHRVWAPLNRYTFEIPVVSELLDRYMGDGVGWADPFAGHSAIAEFRNDLDPTSPQPSHEDAKEWVSDLPSGLNGVVLDPPYTKEQISRHYKEAGKHATSLDTSNNFYARVQDVVAKKVRPDGIVISFGYTGIGLGRGRCFAEVEVLVLVHGAGHYATHVVVEKKSPTIEQYRMSETW